MTTESRKTRPPSVGTGRPAVGSTEGDSAGDGSNACGPAPVRPPAPAYRVPRPLAPADLRLDGNEGAVPDRTLLEPLFRVGPEVLRSYPDSAPLENALARRFGLDPSRVLVTAGGDDAIDRMARAYLAPGREILLPTPTFEMIPRYAELAGAQRVEVPWRRGPLPLEAFLRAINAATSMIAVVSPNNPTGAVASADDLRALATAAPRALLLVDLAYTEFADEDLTESALALPNAVVVRTLSKAYGLAGLRVGYALGPPEILAELRRSGAPYAVARPSLAIAAAAIEPEEHEQRDAGASAAAFVARVRLERDALVERLNELGARPEPSQANFVLARFRDAAWVQDALAGLGIAVRRFPDRRGLENDLRITLPGAPESFDRLLHGLGAAIAPQAILFDLDGVIADVSRSYRAAIEATARRFGVTLGAGEVESAKAAGDANDDWLLTRRLLAAHGVDVPLEEVTRAFETLYQGTADDPGLRRHESLLAPPSYFRELARRFPLAIVTGRPRQDAVRFLREQGMADCFRECVCRDEAEAPKPHPAPVRRALERLGVDRAWMLGDTPDDVRAAREAGVVPIGIVAPGDGDGLDDALIEAGAARRLRSLDELPPLLEALETRA